MRNDNDLDAGHKNFLIRLKQTRVMCTVFTRLYLKYTN